MAKKSFLSLLMVLLIILPGFSQVSDTHKTRKHKHKSKTSQNQENEPGRITVDTPKNATITNPVVAKDTTQKDTSLIGKVGDVVHDSVKAQFKAPIVQVPVTLKSLIIPGALFAYGAITLNNGSLRVINEQANKLIYHGETFKSPYVEDYLLLIPAAGVYGLNLFGLKGQNNLVDRSVMYGMSNLIANGIVFGVKQFGIETRPDNSDKQSFPSGHTAEAFVSAEFLHQEYKGRVHWTVIASGYAIALGVGYLRMYHDKHWLGDVVAGAGVGIASTRFSYYLYPVVKHVIFGSKKVSEKAMILPTYKAGGGFGLAMNYMF